MAQSAGLVLQPVWQHWNLAPERVALNRTPLEKKDLKVIVSNGQDEERDVPEQKRKVERGAR